MWNISFKSVHEEELNPKYNSIFQPASSLERIADYPSVHSSEFPVWKSVNGTMGLWSTLDVRYIIYWGS